MPPIEDFFITVCGDCEGQGRDKALQIAPSTYRCMAAAAMRMINCYQVSPMDLRCGVGLEAETR